MTATHVRITDSDRIRRFTLTRADKRNAMTPRMLEALRDGIASANHRTVLIDAEGDVFSAGFDLKACATEAAHGERAIVTALLERLAETISAARAHGPGVVIACRGAAVAGAAALLAAADVVVSHNSVKIGYPVVKLGLSPAISFPTLASAVGAGSARTRLLDTRLINGAEAHQLGLVAFLMEHPKAVDERALRATEALASKPPQALAATKAWVNAIDDVDADSITKALRTSIGSTANPEYPTRLNAIFNGAPRA